jgi:hypothetical protein
LYFLYFLALHGLIFFNGIFPFFYFFFVDVAGIGVITVSVIWLAVLIWGTIRRQLWAWWGALLYFGLLTISSILALSLSSWQDLLNLMRFAETELDALAGLPFQGIYLMPIVGLPLLLTLFAILYARRYFGHSPASNHENQPLSASN